MKKVLLLFFCIFLIFKASGQLVNDSLEYRIVPDTLKAGNLDLSIYNFNFLRNYEYFNDFQDGYTLFGTQLEPRIVYYPNRKLAVSAGVNIRKDFGKDGITKTFPIFTIKYRNGNTSLINGALEGNIHHRYIEPIFDLERKINNPVEYGTQVVINKPSLFLDAFVNWNKMIDRNSPEQEQIFAGFSTDVSVVRTSLFRFSIPAQLFAFHQGGQIDVNPNPLKTVANTALGFKLQWTPSGFINHIRTENYFVTYSDLSPTKQGIYKNGTALFLNLGVGSTRFGSLTGSFWEGHQYVSPLGMPLYQSVSQQIHHEGYSEDTRRLIILRYVYQRQLVAGFYLDFRVEPVFDLKSPGSKTMEFSHSLFLTYKQDFRLLKRH